jgi:hypothetical protein
VADTDVGRKGVVMKYTSLNRAELEVIFSLYLKKTVTLGEFSWMNEIYDLSRDQSFEIMVEEVPTQE